jgi:hypothetical protein
MSGVCQARPPEQEHPPLDGNKVAQNEIEIPGVDAQELEIRLLAVLTVMDTTHRLAT